MANINQVITLGIGTPASIEHFILFGLNAIGTVTGVVSLTVEERTASLALELTPRTTSLTIDAQ